MEATFRLGPVQEAWIKELEEHPERQTTAVLGYRSKDKPEDYKVCCLGMAAIVTGTGEWIQDENDSSLEYLQCLHQREVFTEYAHLGLVSTVGSSKSQSSKNLANINDSGTTWPEIAALLRSTPEEYFTHSV